MTASGRSSNKCDDQIDRLAGQLRLVPLDVDDDIDAVAVAGRLRPRDRCRWRPRGSVISTSSAEGADLVEDFRVSAATQMPAGRVGPRGRLVGVLQSASCPSRAAAAFAAAWSRPAGRE